jgi:hypothetical protein
MGRPPHQACTRRPFAVHTAEDRRTQHRRHHPPPGWRRPTPRPRPPPCIHGIRTVGGAQPGHQPPHPRTGEAGPKRGETGGEPATSPRAKAIPATRTPSSLQPRVGAREELPAAPITGAAQPCRRPPPGATRRGGRLGGGAGGARSRVSPPVAWRGDARERMGGCNTAPYLVRF